MKKGNMVILSKKAIKRFYGKPERIEDFVPYNDLNHLTSERVIEFMDLYLGFENGKEVGIVDSVDRETVKVIYYCPISDKVDHSYYRILDLDKVKVKIK